MKKWNRDRPLGEVFTGLAQYLDACCLANSADGDGCHMWRQCRNWWDEHCIGAYPDLTLSEMTGLLASFEKARVRWMRKTQGMLPRLLGRRT